MRWVPPALFLVALTLGCDTTPRAGTWSIRFADGDVESRAVRVVAEVRQDTCDGPLEYHADVSPAAAQPPLLGPGTWAFQATAIDDACVAFATDCRILTLPGNGVVALTLQAGDEVPMCFGSCRDGVCPTADAGPGADAEAPGACWNEDLGSVVGTEIASGVTRGATNHGGGDCGGGREPDVVYRWTAPETGTFRIRMCSMGFGWDTLLHVHTVTCDGPEEACDDDSAGACPDAGSTVRIDAIAGTEYFIVADGCCGDDGAFTLDIQRL